eukprot:386564-Rhodomonas_salina.1
MMLKCGQALMALRRRYLAPVMIEHAAGRNFLQNAKVVDRSLQILLHPQIRCCALGVHMHRRGPLLAVLQTPTKINTHQSPHCPINLSDTKLSRTWRFVSTAAISDGSSDMFRRSSPASTPEISSYKLNSCPNRSSVSVIASSPWQHRISVSQHVVTNPHELRGTAPDCPTDVAALLALPCARPPIVSTREKAPAGMTGTPQRRNEDVHRVGLGCRCQGNRA